MTVHCAILLTATVAGAICLGCDGGGLGRTAATQPAGGPPLDPKEHELAALPVGIEVTHSPNPVPAARGGRSGHPYTWLHETAVRAVAGPVTIEEFGCLAWQDGRWVFSTVTGKPFTPAEFSDWYSCPDATLRTGQAYRDPANWTGSTVLEPAQSKWYFIGRTAGGTRVKGEAVVQMLAQVALDQGGPSRDN
jgi:hypothetical protein